MGKGRYFYRPNLSILIIHIGCLCVLAIRHSLTPCLSRRIAYAPPVVASTGFIPSSMPLYSSIVSVIATVCNSFCENSGMGILGGTCAITKNAFVICGDHTSNHILCPVVMLLYAAISASNWSTTSSVMLKVSSHVPPVSCLP